MPTSQSQPITIEYADGAKGEVLRMIDADGRTTSEPRDAVVCVVRFPGEPERPDRLTQVTPDFAPYALTTRH